MTKRNILSSAIFSILVFFSIFYSLPIVHGVDYTISDVEDDVMRECDSVIDTGDYHDEIDIVKLIIAGKNVNITVVGNLAYWNSSYDGSIIFSNQFIPGGLSDLMWTPPYYAIDWDNKSGFIEVTLEKGYSLGGGNFAYEVWNGTGWEDRAGGTAINIVVDVTEHSVTSYIPDAVEVIPTSMKVVAKTQILIFDGCDYIDITPLSTDQGIPSYDIFILICTVIGISLIIKKKIKKKII